jgi:hypothetical protein
MGNLPTTQLRFASMTTVRRGLLAVSNGHSMGYENEPDQTANNQGHRDENYYLLQCVHVFSLSA